MQFIIWKTHGSAAALFPRREQTNALLKADRKRKMKCLVKSLNILFTIIWQTENTGISPITSELTLELRNFQSQQQKTGNI